MTALKKTLFVSVTKLSDVPVGLGGKGEAVIAERITGEEGELRDSEGIIGNVLMRVKVLRACEYGSIFEK